MAQEAMVPITTVQEIARKIAAEEVAKFARSGFLRNASITGGAGLSIRDGGRFRVQYPAELGGDDAAYFGDIYAEDDGSYQGTGALFEQPDGTDIAQFRTDAATGRIRAFINDATGEVVFSADGPGGAHLGRPWIGHSFNRIRWADLSVATTSATFETLWVSAFYKNHAKLSVGIRSGMDTTGTTGEVRVLVNGAALGAPVARGFTNVVDRVLGDVTGAHGEWLVVEIQGRRTSASGALRVEPAYCLGVPSDAF